MAEQYESLNEERFHARGFAFAAYRDRLANVNLPSDIDQLKLSMELITDEFEDLAHQWFSPELKQFLLPNQETIASGYVGPMEEYNRTLHTLLGICILAPKSENDIAKSENDPRYVMFSHLQKNNKISVEHFADLQKTVFKAAYDADHLAMLLTILASHDICKLQTVADAVKREANIDSVDHDLLLGHLTRLPGLSKEFLPAFSDMPSGFRKQAKKVMDTSYNNSQMTQAESTPIQFLALNKFFMNDTDIALMQAENLGDLVGVMSNIGSIYNDRTYLAYKITSEAVRLYRDENYGELDAYLYILNEWLKIAGVKRELYAEDFDTPEGRALIAKARFACVLKATPEVYGYIEDIYDHKLGDKVKKGLDAALSRSGLVEGEPAFMLYYFPDVARFSVQIQEEIDDKSGTAFGVESGMRLIGQIGNAADSYLRNEHIQQDILTLYEGHGEVQQMEFSQVKLRGLQVQVEEFVFMLDAIRKRLKEVLDIKKEAKGEAVVSFKQLDPVQKKVRVSKYAQS